LTVSVPHKPKVSVLQSTPRTKLFQTDEPNRRQIKTNQSIFEVVANNQQKKSLRKREGEKSNRTRDSPISYPPWNTSCNRENTPKEASIESLVVNPTASKSNAKVHKGSHLTLNQACTDNTKSSSLLLNPKKELCIQTQILSEQVKPIVDNHLQTQPAVTKVYIHPQAVDHLRISQQNQTSCSDIRGFDSKQTVTSQTTFDMVEPTTSNIGAEDQNTFRESRVSNNPTIVNRSIDEIRPISLPLLVSCKDVGKHRALTSAKKTSQSDANNKISGKNLSKIKAFQPYGQWWTQKNGKKLGKRIIPYFSPVNKKLHHSSSQFKDTSTLLNSEMNVFETAHEAPIMDLPVFRDSDIQKFQNQAEDLHKASEIMGEALNNIMNRNENPERMMELSKTVAKLGTAIDNVKDNTMKKATQLEQTLTNCLSKYKKFHEMTDDVELEVITNGKICTSASRNISQSEVSKSNESAGASNIASLNVKSNLGDHLTAFDYSKKKIEFWDLAEKLDNQQQNILGPVNKPAEKKEGEQGRKIRSSVRLNTKVFRNVPFESLPPPRPTIRVLKERTSVPVIRQPGLLLCTNKRPDSLSRLMKKSRRLKQHCKPVRRKHKLKGNISQRATKAVETNQKNRALTTVKESEIGIEVLNFEIDEEKKSVDDNPNSNSLM
jgi:hypothetical protein